MTFPTDTITTTALDQTIDNPDIARTELYTVALTVKAIIAATGVGANNSLKLDANGKIPTGVSLADGAASTGLFRPRLFTNSLNQFEAVSYQVQTGRWTKIGRLVFVDGEVSISDFGTMDLTQPFLLGGFPFYSEATPPYGTITGEGSTGLALPAAGIISGRFIGNGNYMNMNLNGSNTNGSQYLLMSHIGTGIIRFNGHYNANR